MPANISLAPVSSPKIIDRPFLDAFTGQTVEDFCTCGFGKKGDEHNHCAHFVSHALGFRFGALCNEMTWNYRKDYEMGRTIRVNDLFNNCPDRGHLSSMPTSLVSCLIFAIISTGINTNTMIMGDVRRKHVGIYFYGDCFNYHNTGKGEGVGVDGTGFFQTLYGKGTVALYAQFPT